jgi:hypothetical protein
VGHTRERRNAVPAYIDDVYNPASALDARIQGAGSFEAAVVM